ncbi:MAG: hypothetical protein M1818_000806 [Claussenomyces sp. TS43310]|nr:MAG: hypothetical protein M1818_000806 [Claussenomyces sp. TS43310]
MDAPNIRKFMFTSEFKFTSEGQQFVQKCFGQALLKKNLGDQIAALTYRPTCDTFVIKTFAGHHEDVYRLFHTVVTELIRTEVGEDYDDETQFESKFIKRASSSISDGPDFDEALENTHEYPDEVCHWPYKFVWRCLSDQSDGSGLNRLLPQMLSKEDLGILEKLTHTRLIPNTDKQIVCIGSASEEGISRAICKLDRIRDHFKFWAFKTDHLFYTEDIDNFELCAVSYRDMKKKMVDTTLLDLTKNLDKQRIDENSRYRKEVKDRYAKMGNDYTLRGCRWHDLPSIYVLQKPGKLLPAVTGDKKGIVSPIWRNFQYQGKGSEDSNPVRNLPLGAIEDVSESETRVDREMIEDWAQGLPNVNELLRDSTKAGMPSLPPDIKQASLIEMRSIPRDVPNIFSTTYTALGEGGNNKLLICDPRDATTFKKVGQQSTWTSILDDSPPRLSNLRAPLTPINLQPRVGLPLENGFLTEFDNEVAKATPSMDDVVMGPASGQFGAVPLIYEANIPATGRLGVIPLIDDFTNLLSQTQILDDDTTCVDGAFGVEVLKPLKKSTTPVVMTISDPIELWASLQQNDEMSTRHFHSTMRQGAAKYNQKSTFPKPEPFFPLQHSLKRPDPTEHFLQGFRLGIHDILSGMRTWNGSMKLEIQFGRILLRKIAHALQGGKTMDPDFVRMSLLSTDQMSSKPLTFTKIVTNLSADAQYLAGLEDDEGKPLWLSNMSRVPAPTWDVIYEIDCIQMESNEEFHIRVDAESFVTRVQAPSHGFGVIYVHCPLRNWDFRVAATGVKSETGRFDVFVQELKDSLHIPSLRERPELYFECHDVHKIRPVSIRVRRVIHYPSADKKSYLHVAEVHRMIMKAYTVSEKQKMVYQAVAAPAKVMASELETIWHEISISSAEADKTFKNSGDIELGEEASWTLDEMMKDDVLKALWQPATFMIKKMDGIGFYNDNGQRATSDNDDQQTTSRTAPNQNWAQQATLSGILRPGETEYSFW